MLEDCKATNNNATIYGHEIDQLECDVKEVAITVVTGCDSA